MEIDTLISDKKYELGLWGWWTAELTDVNQKMFQKIFDKYGPNGAWLFTQATINTNATYRQITTLMMRINSSLKTFIASPGESIHQFTGEFTKTKLFNDSPDIDVAFNLSMMVNMHDNYQCPMQCDGSRTKFKANISKIWKSFGSGSVQAMKTITDATKRLSIAMWGGGGKTTANEKAAIQKRNQELLRSQFGLKTADATTWFFGLKNYRKQFDSASKKFSDGWSAMKTDLGENNQRVALFSSPPMSFEKRKAAREEVNAAIATMEGNRDVTKKKDAQNIALLAKNCDGMLVVDVSQYANIKSSMNWIYAEAADANKGAIIAKQSDVTDQFYQVLHVIRTTIESVIWNRNTQNSLIKNLWDACDAQCKNAGWKCFY